MEPGDVVHFLLEAGGAAGGAAPSPGGRDDEGDDVIVIDDDGAQVVVNPDLLLSGTAIVSGVYCLRRCVVCMACLVTPVLSCVSPMGLISSESLPV